MTELSPKKIVLPSDTLMTRDEARKYCVRIKHSLGNVRLMIFEIFMYQGFIALGFNNPRQFAKVVFPKRESWFYREHSAAQVEHDLDLPIGKIDESVLRPLTNRKLTVHDRRRAWNAATRVLEKKNSNRKYPSAKLITKALLHYGLLSEKKPRELTSAAIVKKATSNFSMLNTEEMCREVLGILKLRRKEIRRDGRTATR